MIFRKLARVLFVLLAVAVLASTRTVSAVGSVDQSYIPPASGWNYVKAHMPIGQSFIPTMNSLTGVDVGIANALMPDQSYNPGFGAGTGYNWINAHTPIGQSFTPTMAVAVGIFLILNKRASKQQRVRCAN